MINQDLFRSYFLVEDKGISIYVKNNTNSKIVFFEKKKIDKNLNNFFINDIQPFFLEKIEKIESQIKLFVDNTVLIIDDKCIFSIGLSLKQKIENRKITEDELKILLSSGLQQIYKNNSNRTIIHYIVDEFNIDGQTTDKVENKVINNYISITLRFISIEKKLVDQYKNLFKKKQILLEKIISSNYLKELNEGNNDKFIDIISKIDNGYNKLEIKLVPKKAKKKGFFESFFLSI
jgi:hypothetical protein